MCIRMGVCGNGILDPGEECDDGNLDDTDDCLSTCKLNTCGDGKVRRGAEECDDGNTVDGDGCDSNCTVTACGNGVVTAGEICDNGNAVGLDGCRKDCTANLLAYIKASNTVKPSNPGVFAEFGASVALSADGSTLAVGAFGEASAATGIGGDQADNSAEKAGAVYVFTRSGTTWTQQAYLKASNTDAFDHFGDRVALSADGSSLAVGAPGEASAATGIDGDQADNSASGAGAVYVFTRSGATWSQQAYLKASSPDTFDAFGGSVALSSDGSTLAVGASGDAIAATGVGDLSGAVYVFTRRGTTWSQQARIQASNPNAQDGFGASVALSADGSTLAVGAFGEASAAIGIDGNQTSNSARSAGAVYVFTRRGTTWSQQAYLKASNTDALDEFGGSVALSADGAILAVGALGEASAATGIGGDQADNSAGSAGAVYVFTRNGATWSQQAYLKASNTGAFDIFGASVALSADGSSLAVGAVVESSAATGIDGDQTDNSTSYAGAVYMLY
jgi:cysteine-rich repeat protein